MSNDDTTPPPPPPPPPSGDPTPESGIAGLAEPPAGDPFAPTEAVGATESDRPDVDSTQVMPVVPTLPTATPTPVEPVSAPLSSGAVAPGPHQTLPPEAWYRQPGAIAGILLGLVIVAGVVLFLILANGDDDDADGVIDDLAPDAVSLVMTRLGSGGQPLDTALSATVTVDEPAADAYIWVIPTDGVVGQASLRSTDGAGRAEFRWAPSDVAIADTWTSTVEIAEFIAPEADRAVTGLAVDCSLERDGSTEGIVVDGAVRISEAGGSADAVGEYSFPNLGLIPGDRVTCTSSNILADAPPVISDPTTTVLESTTTVAETTTTTPPPETTTPPPETTSPPPETTSPPPETTTTTTAPPADLEIGAFLEERPELSEVRALLDRVGLLDELEASDEPFTIFLPTNDAIQDAREGSDPPDFDDDDTVRALFEAHLALGEALDGATIAERTSIEVVNGEPQPVDASNDPIEVGGVPVAEVDNAVDGGIVHVLDGVLPIQP